MSGMSFGCIPGGDISGPLDIGRVVDELRADQRAQLYAMEQRLEALQRSQASGHRQLLSRMDASWQLLTRLDAGLGGTSQGPGAGLSPRTMQPTVPSATVQSLAPSATVQTLSASAMVQSLPSQMSAVQLTPSQLDTKRQLLRGHTKDLELLKAEANVHLTTDTSVAVVASEKAAKVSLVNQIADNIWFKFSGAVVILLSVIAVAMESNATVEYAMGVDLCRHNRAHAPNALDLGIFLNLEYAVIGWMVVELLINVIAAGALCRGPDWGWNMFDFLILLVSVVQMTTTQIATSVGSTRLLRLGRLMKFVRVMRLTKVFKTLRVFQYMHGVRKMVMALVGSVGTLFWALCLMFFLLFLIGVLILQGVEMHYKGMVDDLEADGGLGSCAPGGRSSWDDSLPPSYILPMFNVEPGADHPTEQVAKLYGSVGTTMLTLFSSISGGSEWPVVADPVGRISWVFTVIWILFICLMMFGVMNVLTGIFCEVALSAAASDRQAIIMKEKEERTQAESVLRHSFELIDRDKSGMLTKDEFLKLLDAQEVKAMLDHIGLDSSEAGSLFGMLDDDGSGTINFEEFLQGCLDLKGGAQKIDLIQLTLLSRKLMKGTVMAIDMIDELWSELTRGRPQMDSIN